MQASSTARSRTTVLAAVLAALMMTLGLITSAQTASAAPIDPTASSSSANADASTGSGIGTNAWTPGVSPLYPGEWVQRNVSSADRNAALVLCSAASGIACVAVGQGDGRHSVFHLFRCETRSLSNFIDALAVRNNQTGGAQVRFWGPNYSVAIPADGRIYTVPNHATYDFNRLDIC